MIKLSLKAVQKKTFEGALEAITTLMRDAYETLNYLASSACLNQEIKDQYRGYTSFKNRNLIYPTDLEFSLKNLTELLYKNHVKKSIVIIDEYDTPLTCAAREGYLDPMSLFMKNLFSAVFKANEYLEKGVLIGILMVSKESVLSGLNNIKVCTLLQTHAYQTYFGFTEHDVMDLFKQCNMTKDMAIVKQWYDGYRIGEQSFYNPWSIINYIDDHSHTHDAPPRPYWVSTANDDLLKDSLMAMPNDVKDQFHQLIVTGKPTNVSLSEVVCFEDIKSNSTAMWGLLLGAGITPATELEPTDHHYEGLILIPNREIKGLYIEIFAGWLKDELQISRPSLFRALCQGDLDKFGELTGDYLLKYASHRNLKNEACYHNLLLGLSAKLLNTYHVFSRT